MLPPPTVVLGYALALPIGLSLGLLGAGGSILTVPVLHYVLGFGVKAAVPMSLVVVGLTSAFGAAEHWRDGSGGLRSAMGVGPPGTPAAPGSRPPCRWASWWWGSPARSAPRSIGGTAR